MQRFPVPRQWTSRPAANESFLSFAERWCGGLRARAIKSRRQVSAQITSVTLTFGDAVTCLYTPEFCAAEKWSSTIAVVQKVGFMIRSFRRSESRKEDPMSVTPGIVRVGLPIFSPLRASWFD